MMVGSDRAQKYKGKDFSAAEVSIPRQKSQHRVDLQVENCQKWVCVGRIPDGLMVELVLSQYRVPVRSTTGFNTGTSTLLEST
jgi:hypothetical protein